MNKPNDEQGWHMEHPLSVLIVEDSDSDAELMVRQLRQAGIEFTHERVDTAAAMSAALKNRAWNVVLSDYRLPSFNAGEALAMVRDSGLDIPFIVVSGVIEESKAVELMRSGAHDYLMKSNLSRLAPAVKRELAEAHERHEHRVAQKELRLRVLENEKVQAALRAALEEQRESAAQIRRLNTAYATLSQTNEAIVRMGNREELFDRICRIAVDTGGYLGAWIGLLDDDGKTLAPVARAGSLDDYVASLRISADPGDAAGRGPAATAVREGKPCYSNDFLNDPSTAPWHEQARAFGFRSAAALPLTRRNFVVGTLCLYAAETGVFDGQTRDLLVEMARDVSFALENFDREALRRQAESDMRESERLFRSVVEQNIAAIFMIDDGRIVFANPRTSEILGYTPGELNGRIALELVAEADREDVGRMLQAVASGQVKVIERNISGLHKDGSLVDIGARATLAILDNKPMILAVAQDIGERKKAQEEIQRYVSRLEQAMMTTVEAVSTMVELRDPYTAGHERRVGELAAALGSEMGLPEETITGLSMTGYVHDIGKISIPAEILSKPGRLTAIEYELVKNHSRSGYDILKSVEFPWPLAEIILQHHERMDGSGYPQQLKGEQIILEARIMAVADVVESMASHRPYRPALGLDKALEEIEKNSGRLYDPQVADACLRLFRQRSYRIPD
ncbi:MAG: hypothetical protein CVU18_02410 [Betaproteobacteria bacterium HGW-Betaproteobacteria-12]|nr:MAG: hypothetical protein CVU18_02410 [Betaproteobacteria bacterium HGW-Betaproteobacteria-12]